MGLLSWALTIQGRGPAGDTGQVHSSPLVSRFATGRLGQLRSEPQSLIYEDRGRGRRKKEVTIGSAHSKRWVLCEPLHPPFNPQGSPG